MIAWLYPAFLGGLALLAVPIILHLLHRDVPRRLVFPSIRFLLKDLDPRQACGENKRRLAAAGKKWDNPPFNPARPAMLMASRRAPMRRLMQKLGLTGFRNVGPLREDLLPATRVGLPLKQHVGAPCAPAVSVGQVVKKGDVVASPPVQDGKPALGAAIHASIDGTVSAVADGVIWIEKDPATGSRQPATGKTGNRK